MCGFNRRVGESQTQPKLQRLVATLRKRQQEEVEARVKAEGWGWQEKVTQAEKTVQAARRAVEDEHWKIYRKVVAEHERYMERTMPYKTRAHGGWKAAGDPGSETTGWQSHRQ